MEKILLSEKALYTENVSMPKGFEINREELKANILESKLTNNFKFCTNNNV